MTHDDEDRQLKHVQDDLVKEFATLDATVVEQYVSQVVSTFTTAPVRSFVPVLVRRRARARLLQLH